MTATTNRFLSRKKAHKRVLELASKGIEAEVKYHSIKYRTDKGIVLLPEFIVVSK